MFGKSLAEDYCFQQTTSVSCTSAEITVPLAETGQGSGGGLAGWASLHSGELQD